MDMFAELKRAALEEHEQGELPAGLLAEILAIAENPGHYGKSEEGIRLLIMQIQHYDPYAGAGCFSFSFSLEDIRRTLRQFSSTLTVSV
jgi:hypothetical protein